MASFPVVDEIPITGSDPYREYLGIEFLVTRYNASGVRLADFRDIDRKIRPLEDGASAFQYEAKLVAREGFFLDENTLVAPGAIISIRRTDARGNSIDKNGRRVTRR